MEVVKLRTHSFGPIHWLWGFFVCPLFWGFFICPPCRRKGLFKKYFSQLWQLLLHVPKKNTWWPAEIHKKSVLSKFGNAFCFESQKLFLFLSSKQGLFSLSLQSGAGRKQKECPLHQKLRLFIWFSAIQKNKRTISKNQRKALPARVLEICSQFAANLQSIALICSQFALISNLLSPTVFCTVISCFKRFQRVFLRVSRFNGK